MSRPERCKFCESRSKSPEGGCLHSEPGLPMMPSPDSKCVFIKRGEPSRFELAERYKVEHGRVYTPYESNSAPGVAVKPGKPPDMSGRYVVVCRDHKSFIHDTQTDEVFSDCEERKPMGKIQDFDEPTYSPEEMDAAIAEGRKLMLKHLTE